MHCMPFIAYIGLPHQDLSKQGPSHLLSISTHSPFLLDIENQRSEFNQSSLGNQDQSKMDKLKGMASKMGGGSSEEQKPAAGGEQQDYVDKGVFSITRLLSI